MRQKTFDFIPGQKVNATRQCWIMQKQLVYLTILFTILFSILFLDPPGTFMGYAITSFDYFLYLTFDWWLKYIFELVYNRNVKGHYNPYLNVTVTFRKDLLKFVSSTPNHLQPKCVLFQCLFCSQIETETVLYLQRPWGTGPSTRTSCFCLKTRLK